MEKNWWQYVSNSISQILGFIFDGLENIVEKGENVGYYHILLFQQC